MNIAIYLGTVTPPLIGQAQQYIDGRPVMSPIKPRRCNDHGDKVRQRIMDIVRRTGQSDIKTICDGVGLVSQGVRIHLRRLVHDGLLIRIDPHRRGAGCAVLWRTV